MASEVLAWHRCLTVWNITQFFHINHYSYTIHTKDNKDSLFKLMNRSFRTDALLLQLNVLVLLFSFFSLAAVVVIIFLISKRVY